MRALARREVIARLSAIPALGCLGAQSAFVLVQTAPKQAEAARFNPPTTNMRFSRTLIRELRGGASIVVTREWSVEFLALGSGYSLDGAQTSVEVSTPTGLEGLANLERSRVERGIFPLMLSNDGLIVGEKTPVPGPAIDQAIEHAKRDIAFRNLDQSDQRSVDMFLNTLQNSAQQAVSRLPRDLFCPRNASRGEQRAIPLGSGNHGEIRVNFAADIPYPMAPLNSASRTITTQIGGSIRKSIERWAMAKIETSADT